MELLLDKKKYEYLHRASCGNTIHEETSEIIVSDRSPDIMRIVRSAGNVFVTSKDIRDGKAYVEGSVCGVVLYVAEGEQNIRKIEVKMPFFHTFDASDAADDSKLRVRAYLRSLDVREINPRKISVRANVDISYCVFERAERTFCEGVSSAEEYGICTKKRKVYGYNPVIIREKPFSISDDIELSGKESEMNGVLIGEVGLVSGETKIIGNKAVIKGKADVRYVYEVSDGTLCGEEREIPFSQILDIDGMEEWHDIDIELSVTGVEFDPQYDAAGKARYMTVSVTADAFATVYEKNEGEIIDDAYSTMYETDVKRNGLTSAKLVNKEKKRVPITECVQTGSAVKSVLSVSVEVYPPVRRREDTREFLSSDASVSVMYIGDDDSVYSASRRVCVVCPVELSDDHTFEISASISNRGYSIGAENEINVRFFTDFDITESVSESILAVCEILADTESCRHAERCPSVTVRRIGEGCDVWTLAKENATTVEKICLANGLSESEKIAEGRMILIPRNR